MSYQLMSQQLQVMSCELWLVSYKQYNMKSYIVRKNQKPRSLSRRQKTIESEDGLRASSIAERTSEASKSLFVSKARGQSKSVSKYTLTPPYQQFIKDMHIKLPTPKQKFEQFLKIPPFNRLKNHNEMIGLFLKNVTFFKIHQPALVKNMARKVRMLQVDEIQQKMMVIVLEGECMYKGQPYSSGQILNRETFERQSLVVDPSAKLLALNKHEYLSFVSSYIHQEMIKLKEFLNSIQLFKMFSEKTIQRFTEYMTLHYFLKGQKLYRVGDEANCLYVVYSGKVSRKVVIQIQKVNKIPHSRFVREVRILNKSYSHQIQFNPEEIVGVSEIIDNVSTRKEEIEADQNSVLLAIDRSIIEENMDDYVVDRLKKYNLKKYPANYDQLCDNYLKEKTEMKKVEERKINALQQELKNHQSERRREKIESIIRMYEQNIRKVDSRNLLNKNLHFEEDANK